MSHNFRRLAAAIILISAFLSFAARDSVRAAGAPSDPVRFTRVLALVFDARTLEPIPACIVTVGQKTFRTDENGYFEIPTALAGEYVVAVDKPPYERYAQVHDLASPLGVIRVGLSPKVPELTELERQNREYDATLGRIMRLNTSELMIGEEPPTPEKKHYIPAFGAEFSSGEKGFRGKRLTYSKATDKEISMAPRISTSGGFGKLVGQVRDSKGEAIRVPARIKVTTSAFQTEPDGSYSLDGVPAGKHSLRVSCPGYQTYEDTTFVVLEGRNKVDFHLIKIDKDKK